MICLATMTLARASCADLREMILNSCPNCSINNAYLVYNYKEHGIANGILTKIDTPNMPTPTQKIHKHFRKISCGHNRHTIQ